MQTIDYHCFITLQVSIFCVCLFGYSSCQYKNFSCHFAKEVTTWKIAFVEGGFSISSEIKCATRFNSCCTRTHANLAKTNGIAHFTVVCLVAWPLNESEAGGDLVLIETSLLFSC